MDRVDIGDLGGRDNAIALEIAFSAGSGADADRFVGELYVEGLLVGLGIDGQGLDSEFVTSANDAKCDFAPVCDENLFDHPD